LPWHLVFHGLALTSWYVLLLVQAALIRRGKTSLHRKLGVAGVVSALAVVTSGFIVLTQAVSRRVVDGVLPPVELIENAFRPIALYQTFNLTFFLACVGAAVYFRRKPDIHKRLMIIASVLILGAALSTDRSFGAAVQNSLPFLDIGATTIQVLVGSMLVFDLVDRRRLFAVSIFGAVLILVVQPVWMNLMLGSELGNRWTNWLGNIPG
jgi:hypothetical protein